MDLIDTIADLPSIFQVVHLSYDWVLHGVISVNTFWVTKKSMFIMTITSANVSSVTVLCIKCDSHNNTNSSSSESGSPNHMYLWLLGFQWSRYHLPIKIKGKSQTRNEHVRTYVQKKWTELIFPDDISRTCFIVNTIYS